VHELAHVVTIMALLSAGALLGAALYDAVVLAPNLRGGPQGLEHGRLFMTAATPAKLFRVLAPASQVLVLGSIAANWSSPAARWPLVGALIALVASDVITFKYHYPRNRVLFTAPLEVSAEQLGRVARQWTSANLVRIVLVLLAWIGTLTAVLRGPPWS
jgi:uncharacterized membrane protein